MILEHTCQDDPHWGFFLNFDAVVKSRLLCSHTRIVLRTRLKSQSKMAASSVNIAMAKEISKE